MNPSRINPPIAPADELVRSFEQGRLSRRQLVMQLMALGAATAGLPLGAAGGEPQTQPASTFTATQIDHVALAVTDVKRSIAFYQKHLGLKLTRDGGDNSAFLNCGSDFLALFRAEKPALHHYSFTIKGYNAADAVKSLEAASLKPSRQGDRVYFPDPDGLVVQVRG